MSYMVLVHVFAYEDFLIFFFVYDTECEYHTWTAWSKCDHANDLF